MIRYALVCAKDQGFEAWFRSSADFDEQADAGDIVCPVCGDDQVRKAIMAPAVAKSSGASERADVSPAATDVSPEQRAAMALGKALEALHRHVAETCDYVGDKFAEEARRMHYGETEHRDIYGETTLDEARELLDEGIEALPLPRRVTDRH